jgi:Zn-dependent peptidase ImmA (M78 family)
MARVYKLPVLTLAAPTIPEKSKRPTDFRTVDGRSSQLSYKTAVAIRRARYHSESILDLHEEYPELHVAFSERRLTLNHHPARAGMELRAESDITLSDQLAWRTDSEAFQVWRDWVESLGIYVFVLDFPIDDCRGFSLNERVPLVVLSKNETSYAARVFTLIHEYCHLLLGKPGLSAGLGARNRVERYCNVFAARFLMTDDALERLSLTKAHAASEAFGASQVRSAATRLKVSAQALSLRLEESELVPKGFHRQFTPSMRLTRRAAGGPVPPAAQRLSELGTTFSNNVMNLRKRGELGDLEASRLLNLSPRHFGPLEERLTKRGQAHAPGHPLG